MKPIPVGVYWGEREGIAQMKMNVGGLDRALRVVLGLTLLFLGYSADGGALVWVGYIAGAVLLLTGIFGFCGLYALLGINTCSVSKR